MYYLFFADLEQRDFFGLASIIYVLLCFLGCSRHQNDFHFSLKGPILRQHQHKTYNDIDNDGDDDAAANDTSKINFIVVKRLRDFRFLLFPFQSRLSHSLREFPVRWLLLPCFEHTKR